MMRTALSPDVESLVMVNKTIFVLGQYYYTISSSGLHKINSYKFISLTVIKIFLSPTADTFYCAAGGRMKMALQLQDVKHVTEYLMNFADQHGMVLPGRVPGFARDDLRVLPSHFTRKAIWQWYDEADTPALIRKVKLRAFCQLWKQLLPFIVVAKPASDLCWVCQQNNTKVLRYILCSH